MATVYTEPQRRAILTLPGNGAWLVRPQRGLAPALDSLYLYHRDLVEQEWGEFGQRGGWCRRARLTSAGMHEQRRLCAQAEP